MPGRALGYGIRWPTLYASGGHRAHSVTLTGLEPDAEEPSRVGLDDHVKDGLAMLSGLDDVILVAHDYGGMVAGLVADHVPEQVTHSIYIEGFVPRDGLSTLDGLPDNQLAAERALIEAAGGALARPPITSSCPTCPTSPTGTPAGSPNGSSPTRAARSSSRSP
ncbi:alpha/beta hydrolase [Nonomuraea salmonea]|uniref:alpha/beta fold hydrolase n=1 Tax=Nonomuraea salmonea TaxID=46181 RepID=UPI002FED5F84